MAIIGFLLFLFVVLVGGGWLIGKSLGRLFFPSDKDPYKGYVDKSVHHHHHYHDNRSLHVDGEVYKSLKK